MVGWVRRWSRQSDHYDWLSAYILERGLEPRWRTATFISTISLAAMPIVMLGSPFGPDNTATVALSIGTACLGAGTAVLWLRRWPSRDESILFSLAGSVCIAATCVAQSNPYAGLSGCALFAIIGGFIAYFHSIGFVTLNFALAAICSAFLAHRLAVTTGDIALTVATLITVTSLNLGVPFGIESLVHTMRDDVRSSGHDPLTSLLNRRSFYPAAYELLMRHRRATETYLIVLTVDLDNFKRVNDTRGHAAGDEALVLIAAALRDNCRATAVIGRTGGEEFVIADVDSEAEPAALAERLRRAIAANPFDITASIGTASAPMDISPADSNLELIDSLIRRSDAAMYDAKRAGGDRIQHSEDPA